MAVFQKRVYHEDITEKHALSREDLSFLLELQKELNTQPNMGNADPLYWGIIETQETPTSEDYADTSVICDECGEVVARDLDELADYLSDNMYEINRVSCEDGTLELTFSYGETESANDFDEALEILSDHDIDGLRMGYLREESRLRMDAMFLTHKDCEGHLEKFGYNYADTAHAYAMTADRSFSYGKLLNIIRTVDWQAVMANLEGQQP